MTTQGYEIGMVGLGVMGRNLLLNMADHGHSVAGLDRNPAKVQALKQEGAGKPVEAATRWDEFVALLRRPRAIILLVPAGPPVDAVIGEALPLLGPGDLIIDSGNSHFTDTERRGRDLADKGFHLLGMGISGGEAGARHGPSMMPGGPPEAYERVRPVLEDVAARVGGEPCVAYIGPRSAGHYVKMVHNGIEYGLMQLIAETYDLMRRGLGLTNDEMHAAFAEWNRGLLNSFLVEITAEILLKPDDRTGNRLVDMVLDVARQKGTGKWASQDAMNLQAPIPTIDAAVSTRDLSGHSEERDFASRFFPPGPPASFTGDRNGFLASLHNGLYAAMVLTYAQGLALLRRASDAYGYELNLEAVVRIWRGGCIIRAALLEDVRVAYQAKPDLTHLLQNVRLAKHVGAFQADLRTVVRAAAEMGIPAPGLMAALAYYDGYRSARLPTNLIQSQRDYFGAHTYERVDVEGTFHTQWARD